MPDRLTDERLKFLTLANEIEHRVNVCLRMVRRL
jgi:hypothetical protein